MNDLEYLSKSFDEVYSWLGGIGMKYFMCLYYRGFKNSLDYIDYDFENKIPINATINSTQTSDVDLETTTAQLTTNKRLSLYNSH